MKIETMQNQGLERELRVIISKDELQQAFDKELNKLMPRAKVDGFPKGKAPKEIICKEYGSSLTLTVFKQKRQEILRIYHQEHPKDRVLISSFSIESDIGANKLDQGILSVSDLTVKMKIFLRPQMPEIKFDEIVLEDPDFCFSDAFVEAGMARFARFFHTSIPMKKKRKAQEGDTVVYSMEYKTSSGEKKKVPVSFVLGSYDFPHEFEDLFPRIEGGQSVTESLPVPDNFPEKSLVNKSVLFTVSLSEVRETVRHELNEAFLEDKGFESMEDFKYFFLERMMPSGTYLNDICCGYKRMQLRHKLVQNLDFDVPKFWFDEEWHEFTSLLKKRFKDVASENAFLKEHYGISADQKLDFFKQMVLTNVRGNVLLEDLCEKRKVSLTKKEYDYIVEDILDNPDLSKKDVETAMLEDPNPYQGIFREHKYKKLLNELIDLCPLEEKEWEFGEFQQTNAWGSMRDALKKEKLISFYFLQMVDQECPQSED
jgi:trigger factor